RRTDTGAYRHQSASGATVRTRHWPSCSSSSTSRENDSVKTGDDSVAAAKSPLRDNHMLSTASLLRPNLLTAGDLASAAFRESTVSRPGADDRRMITPHDPSRPAITPGGPSLQRNPLRRPDSECSHRARADRG